MGKKKDLSAAEKRQIVQYLGQGITTLDISKRIACDHRTVKKFVTDSQHKRVRSDKGKIRKISAKQMRRVKRAATTMPLKSSKQVFEAAGASRTSRCRMLKRFASVLKPVIRPPLNQAHKQKRLQWAQDYMKTFKLFCLRMSAVQPLMVLMDGVVDGW